MTSGVFHGDIPIKVPTKNDNQEKRGTRINHTPHGKEGESRSEWIINIHGDFSPTATSTLYYSYKVNERHTYVGLKGGMARVELSMS
jgi:hypothetical protein